MWNAELDLAVIGTGKHHRSLFFNNCQNKKLRVNYEQKDIS